MKGRFLAVPLCAIAGSVAPAAFATSMPITGTGIVRGTGGAFNLVGPQFFARSSPPDAYYGVGWCTDGTCQLDVTTTTAIFVELRVQPRPRKTLEKLLA